MAEGRSYIWIIYIGIAGAVALVGYALYQYFAGQGPQQNVQTCYNEVANYTVTIQNQIAAFQKANGSSVFSTEQEAIIAGMQNTLSTMMSSCTTLAAQTNQSETSSSNGLWAAVTNLLYIVGAITIVSIILKIAPSVLKSSGQIVSTLRQANIVNGAQTGEITVEDASAGLAQADEEAIGYAGTDQATFTVLTADLQTAYDAAVAAGDTQSADLYASYIDNVDVIASQDSAIMDSIEAETIDYLAGLGL